MNMDELVLVFGVGVGVRCWSCVGCSCMICECPLHSSPLSSASCRLNSTWKVKFATIFHVAAEVDGRTNYRTPSNSFEQDMTPKLAEKKDGS
jgi:hypothetical protein